jgi:pyruvate,orthophosphate dikinase
MKKKMVYFFGAGKADGDASMRATLGGKGAGLAEMVRLGLPVPAGLTISADVCAHFAQNRGRYPHGLKEAVEKALRKIERVMKARFGDPDNPLLVSVRSGAAISMPGMMDTVLNLGLNDRTVKGLAQRSNDPRFAYDCYRRFVQMYGDVVLGLKAASSTERDPFEVLLERKKEDRGVQEDHELSAEDLKDLVRRFKEEIRERTGKKFPENPERQLWGAIGAVFLSWNNDRAVSYRRLQRIVEDLGTAVNVQAMVYGNTGAKSGTGVAFTRSPASGEKQLYGEYLLNAQGEDVVAGIRTPRPIAELQQEMPHAYAELDRIRHTLEQHYREMQDLEFTIQHGQLWMLQTRTGKRSGLSAVRIAVDMVREKLITAQEALLRVEAEQLNQLLQPTFLAESKGSALQEGRLLGRGLPAGPGAASGNMALSAEEAVRRRSAGEDVILVRSETSPDDIEGMNAALGILTQRGGMTSHAALVGRQMGKVCVVGCGDLLIDYVQGTVRAGERVFREGDAVSIDGNTGEVFAGGIVTRPSEVIQVLLEKSLEAKDSPTFQRFTKLLSWADKHRRLKVRSNADTGEQCQAAVTLGAEGVGLCRTEHMFFGPGKIEHVQHMILADSTEERRAALAHLEPLQRQDFGAIFEAMNGRPVTVRLLDPPLHEFLPHTEADQQELAQTLQMDAEQIRAKVSELHEFNPMLGFRGCRLGIVYSEITEMQARALFHAVCDIRERKIKVLPEVMVPLVGHHKELRAQESVIRRVAEEVQKERKIRFAYQVGTMIEVPRAALTATEIAEVAEFFSFGTNDLTQTALGLSRDDSARFLEPYLKREIYTVDPFQSLDEGGVGRLVQLAVEGGQSARPGIKLGICGEHGGDPESVDFFHRVGLDYVSCSPYRLPIARVAAAQGALREEARRKQAEEAEKASRRGRRKPARKKPTARKKAPQKKAPQKKAKSTARKRAATKKAATKKTARKKTAGKVTRKKTTRKKTRSKAKVRSKGKARAARAR